MIFGDFNNTSGQRDVSPKEMGLLSIEDAMSYLNGAAYDLTVPETMESIQLIPLQSALEDFMDAAADLSDMMQRSDKNPEALKSVILGSHLLGDLKRAAEAICERAKNLGVLSFDDGSKIGETCTFVVEGVAAMLKAHCGIDDLFPSLHADRNVVAPSSSLLTQKL